MARGTDPHNLLLQAVLRANSRLYYRDSHGKVGAPDTRVPARVPFSIHPSFLRLPAGPGDNLQVLVLGDDKVFAKLRATPRIIRSEIVGAARDAADLIYDSMLQIVHYRSGELAAGLFVEVVNAAGKKVELRIGGTSGHTRPVELGTGIYGEFKRPYLVRRAFRGSTVSGGPIFHAPDPFHPSARLRSAAYLHPGMRARPFVGPAIKLNATAIAARMKQIGPRIVQRAEKGLG